MSPKTQSSSPTEKRVSQTEASLVPEPTSVIAQKSDPPGDNDSKTIPANKDSINDQDSTDNEKNTNNNNNNNNDEDDDDDDEDDDDDDDNDDDTAPNKTAAKPTTPAKSKQTVTTTNTQVYSAIYSNVPVYEMLYKGVQVMLRIHDGWLNATQILKVAGFSKPKRTKILDVEILQQTEYVFEKIQGGYGKYQGTWIPREEGIKLAKRYHVDKILRPILDFLPDNNSIVLSKSNFNAQNQESKVSSSSSGTASGSGGSKTNTLASAAASLLPPSDRSLRASSEPLNLRSSVPPSPQPSPLGLRNARTAPTAAYNDSREDSPVPAPPIKRSVGRPPRIPRPPNAATPPPKTPATPPPRKIVSRRVSHDYIDVPTSPPGVRLRVIMELGNALFLPESHQALPLPILSTNRRLTLSHNPLLFPAPSLPFTPTEYVPSTFPHDTLQREIILAIYTHKPVPEILRLLQIDTTTFSKTPQIDPNMILTSRQHTPLHWSTFYAHIHLTTALLSYSANPSARLITTLQTPLHFACTSTCAYTTATFPEMLTALGPATLRATTASSETILHIIARECSTGLATNDEPRVAACEYYIGCILDWLDSGGFQAWIDDFDSTIEANSAAYRVHVKSVVGAFIDARDSRGDTAVHVAVRGGCVGIVRILVRLGCRIDGENLAGERVEDIAAGEEMERVFRCSSVEDVESDSETEPMTDLEYQLSFAKPEISNLHKSQARLEVLHQQALNLRKRLSKQLQTFRKPPTITFDRTTAAVFSTSQTSPSTSVSISSYDDGGTQSSTHMGKRAGAVSASIQIPHAPQSPEHSPQFGASAFNSDSENPHPQVQYRPPHQEVSPPMPTRRTSVTKALTHDTLAAPPPPPTPPTTVKASSVGAVTGLKRLQGKVEIGERAVKRLVGEIEDVWMRRGEKDKRFKRLVADACGVGVDDVDYVLDI